MAISRTVVAVTALLAAAAVPALAQQTRQGTAAPAPDTTSPGTTSPSATQGNQMSDTMVRKVGTALRHVATIRQQYADKAQSVNSPQQRQDLTDQAEKDMLKAIKDQGLSIQQYDQAIQMAQADPSLRQRLVSVAQAGN